MDEAVLRAVARWPNVPAVAGWLRLDRRGRWLVRNAATDAFEPITNPQITAFIGRNYERDDRGRWFFQNGPQRVYVALEATPFVYRIADGGTGLVAQNDAPAGTLHRLLLDTAGALVVDAALGPGLVVDRDLPLVLDRMQTPAGHAIDDARLEGLMAGGAAFDALLWGAAIRVERVDPAELGARFGYLADPPAD